MEYKSEVIRTPENLIPSVFNREFGRTLKKITIPYSKSNLEKLSVFSTVYSNFFQSIAYYDHNNFEIYVLIEEFVETSVEELKKLSVDQVERLFLQFIAVFRLLQSHHLDFVDLTRFNIQPDFSVKFPLDFTNNRENNIDNIVSVFRGVNALKSLNKKNASDIFKNLCQKYSFTIDRAYFYNYDEFACNILNNFSLEDLRNDLNLKIKINTSHPIQEKIIKLNLHKHFLSEENILLEVNDPSHTLPHYFSMFFQGTQEKYQEDFVSLTNQLENYLKKSLYKSLILIIDIIKTKEDAEFVNFLMDSSGISNIIIFIFQSSEKCMEYDLELKERPRNYFDTLLLFDESIKPNPLLKEEIDCLKIIQTLSGKVSYDLLLKSEFFSEKQISIINQLIAKKHLKILRNELTLNVSTIGTVIQSSSDEEIAILESFLSTNDSWPLEIKYFIQTNQINKLIPVLKEYSQSGFRSHKDYLEFKKVFSENLNVMKENLQLLRLFIGILVGENDFELAETLINEHMGKDPDFFSLKLAQIFKIRKDYQQMFLVLKKIRGLLPQGMMDEFYYLNFYYYEKLSNVKKSNLYLKKIKNPLHIHLSNIKFSDRYIYSGDINNAAKLLNNGIDFLSQKGFLMDELDARSQMAKLLREKEDFTLSEKIYKNIFIRSEMNNYRLLSANISVDLGNLYFTIDDFKRAEVWYKRALNIFKKQKNKTGVFLAESNLVEINKIKGNWEEAKKILKSILIHDKEKDIADSIAIDYYNIAHLEYLKHNEGKSLEYLKKAVHLFEKRKNIIWLIEGEFLRIKMFVLFHGSIDLKQSAKNIQIDLSTLKQYRQHLNNDQKNLLSIFELIMDQTLTFKLKYNRILGKLDQIQSRTMKYEMILLLINNFKRIDLMDRLKSLSKELSKKRKNYYYFEFYYTYFSNYLLTKEIRGVEKEIFYEIYHFFTRNKRRLLPIIVKHKNNLDEKDSTYDVFESAELVGDYLNWKIPQDFFDSLKKDLSKRIPLDLIKLVIYERENILFQLSTDQKFKELTDEIVTRVRSSVEDYNLSIDDIKRVFTSANKAFYFFRNTKVIHWRISENLFGYLLLASIKEDFFEYNFVDRNRELLKKYAILIDKYTENVFKLGKKLKNIIGQSPAIKRLKDEILKVSKVNFPLLITGESGTGKELVAKGVHLMSLRSKHPFIPVNAAAIPHHLLEAELFGYRKGAFTGATESKTGLIEAADEGTLFLDEVADLPPNLQAKLLRVLQDNVVRRLGETKSMKVNFRLISATNKDLKELINRDLFREDLYFRIQDLTIYVPPLRKRVEDIPLLVHHFLEKYKFPMEDKTKLQAIFQHFKTKTWTGNIRELESNVKRLITFYPDFEMEGQVEEKADTGLIQARENLEKSMVLNALQKNDWNKVKTAEFLKISRQFLFNLMKKYDISLDT